MPSNKCKPLPRLTETDVERFHSRVAVQGPDECWPWTAGRNKQGYGLVWLQLGNCAVYAARVAYLLFNGTDPYPLLVRHSCDNPPCCNPKHLLTGTHKDNKQDEMDRNRTSRGEHRPNSILTEESALQVRLDRQAGMTIPALCEKYHVTQGAIIPVLTGEHWKHVDGPRFPRKRQLTPDLVRQIRHLRNEGMILKDLAAKFNMSLAAIHALISRQTWYDVD